MGVVGIVNSTTHTPSEMRIGLIARADSSRGLGAQTHALYEHLSPHRTLVVAMGARTPYHEDWSLYHLSHTRKRSDRVRVSEWQMDGSLADEDIEWLLNGSDLIFTAETPYDYRILEWAASRSIPTIVQANFEFCGWLQAPHLPRPTLFAFPSEWYQERWPANSIYLPFPVDTQKFPFKQRSSIQSILHIGGHPTRDDRDGTFTVLEYTRHVPPTHTLTITSQNKHFRRQPRSKAHIHYQYGDHDSLAPIYANHDLLLLPRRWGGQSLKLNEALASGLPVLMPNFPPQNLFLPPEMLIRASEGNTMRTQAGWVETCRVQGNDLKVAVRRYLTDDDLVSRMSKWAGDWANEHSWRKWAPKYQKLFREMT